MRRRRYLGSLLLAAGVLMLLPVGASADGGAYIDLDRTHFIVGSTGRAETYVAVPASKQHLFERGPFYLFVTPARSPVTEGEALPVRAVRVATMTIEHDRGTAFELSASFTVPDLPGDYYALGVCNDPCTISGFREPLTGDISIVQTAREADLLNERERLEGQMFSLKKQIRKLEHANADLTRRLRGSGLRQSELSAELTRLRGALAVAREQERRHGSLPWPAITLGLAVMIIGGVLVIARRQGSMKTGLPEPDLQTDITRPRVRAFR